LNMNIQQFTIRVLDEKLGILEKRYASAKHRVAFWRDHLRGKSWNFQSYRKRYDDSKKEWDHIRKELKEYRIRRIELKEYFNE